MLAELVNMSAYIYSQQERSPQILLSKVLLQLCTTLQIPMDNYQISKLLFSLEEPEFAQLEFAVLNRPEQLF